MPNSTYLISLQDDGESFNCNAGEHLLLAMSKTGKKGIPSGCHGGGCGVCKIQIHQGSYDSKVMSRAHITLEEQESGCVLACRVFPTSDLQLSVVGKLQKRFLTKT